MNLQEAVNKWKELSINRAEFEFDCGGDSMNDTTLNFYDKKDKIIINDDLADYFDDQVYKEVNFYEASDGHYQGERGVVHIELDNESDNVDEHSFTYTKSAESEFNEQYTETIYIDLTDEQATFIAKNVSNINGGEGDMATFNFSRDFIMVDRDDEIMVELTELIDNTACEYEFENAEGEQLDWYSYTTNSDENELTIDEGKLKLVVSRTFVVYTESDD
jgi:hypothetical protein